MRVLLAFDKFKDSLAAPAACAVAAETLRAAHPDWEIDSAPLADGGDGFAAILTAAAGGEMVPVRVVGPLGETRTADYGIVSFARIPAAARARLALPPLRETDTIALVEMAAASGLALVPPAERNPWRTTSYGTGQLLAAAAQRGARALLLGVGGSATHDLGLGALGALGLKFFDTRGAAIFPPTTSAWDHIARLAGHVPAAFPPLRVACDVTNPLLGPTGAAAIYAPQKGLTPADLPALESATARMAALLAAHCGQPRSLAHAPGVGAAGGIAFGLTVAARAQLVPGWTLVHDWLDLENRIAAADLVITGEGRFDASSLNGKGPGALVAAAAAAGKPVLILAGSLGKLPPTALSSLAQAHAITPPNLPLATALTRTPELLATALRQHLAALLRLPSQDGMSTNS
ncbi:MAG TPA: glycerate kinase [Opitutaceae bacterium]|nr:glycerate kinase [Opitutaceae bacterium]